MSCNFNKILLMRLVFTCHKSSYTFIVKDWEIISELNNFYIMKEECIVKQKQFYLHLIISPKRMNTDIIVLCAN